jgi:RNA recognition motif-containing protein
MQSAVEDLVGGLAELEKEMTRRQMFMKSKISAMQAGMYSLRNTDGNRAQMSKDIALLKREIDEIKEDAKDSGNANASEVSQLKPLRMDDVQVAHTLRDRFCLPKDSMSSSAEEDSESFSSERGELMSHAGDSELTIFVRNISYHTEPKKLGEAFSKFGDIAGVRIITDMVLGQRVSAGFGFVDFKTQEAFQKAVDNQDPLEVDGRRLFVKAARLRQPRKRDTAFVKGIPESTTEDDIKSAFGKYNPTEVRIIRKNSGDLKGFAFVSFDTEEHQSAAVKENRNIMIKGEESRVAFALPRRANNRRFGRQGPRPKSGPHRAPRAQSTGGPIGAGPTATGG